MKKNKWVAVLMIILLSISSINPASSEKTVAAEGEDSGVASASEIVKDMGVGWNLGNTLDSYGNYNQYSNYQLVGFYMDGGNYTWNMSDSVFFQRSEGTSSNATLSWSMKGLKSGDTSKPASIGFQIWNFSGDVSNGMELKLKITNAELTTGGKLYSFPELLGDHTLTVKDSVASLGTDIFDKALTKTSQLKAGTFTIAAELILTNAITKQMYFETLWGNPLTTKALIDEIKAAGFNAVRVPATWYTNMDADGKIDKEWLERTEVIVNYILDSGMYCILNSHHDTGHITASGSGWLKADTSNQDIKEHFTQLWEQVATHFSNYGDHLLFEGFNEILIQDAKGNDIWGYPGEAAIASVNELNQIFVDTVRKSGGNNATRPLVVNTYAASSSQSVIDGFVLPKDTVKERLIVEVHDYTPMEFGWYDVTWTTMRDTWGTTADKANLDAIFDRLDKRFVSQGTPVIVGEFGTSNKNNTSERAKHAAYYTYAAAKKGITCFWWDNGGEFEVAEGKMYEGAGLINRRTLEWPFQEVVDALVNASDGTSLSFFILPAKTKINSITSDKPSQATLQWSECTGAAGYQIIYSNSKNGTYKNLATTSKLSLTVNKLVKNKSYYFKVRAYIMIDNVKYYGEYSLAKSIRIK